MNLKQLISVFALMLFIVSCGGDEDFIPKPKSYFRIDFPAKEYQENKEKCHTTYEHPTYSYILEKPSPREGVCFQNIVFPYYKASIYCTYLKLDSNFYEHSEEYRKKAYEHQSRAQAIDEKYYVDEDKKVYGATFDIQGDVACNYIFYLTDSTDNFFAGQVFFEAIPNYDSLQPVIEFVKEDIVHLIETFEWDAVKIEESADID